ncbi:MAG TPA: hypothetical protein VIG08_10900 [Gemmatimonadales bacterium]
MAGPQQTSIKPSLELIGGIPGFPGGGLGDGLLSGLLACPSQPEYAAEEEIGPEGGTLRIGPHKLVVPPGALEDSVLISGTAVSDSVVSVSFQPEGLTFAVPAHLTLSYVHCPVVASLLPKRIAYTSDVLDLLQLLNSNDDPFRRRVSADLDHFSRYAVAW